MEEQKKQIKTEKIDTEELDQISGGALWYDAMQVIGGVRKKKSDVEEFAAENTAEKKGMMTTALDELGQGADRVKERLDIFADS